jgi:hypothetical protein
MIFRDKYTSSLLNIRRDDYINDRLYNTVVMNHYSKNGRGLCAWACIGSGSGSGSGSGVKYRFNNRFACDDGFSLDQDKHNDALIPNWVNAIISSQTNHDNA